MPKVYWRNQKGGGGGEVEFDREVTVGRSKDNSISPLDPLLSRHHARIFREGDVLLVEDRQSRNGTQLNGSTVTRCELSPGDEVLVGHTVLRLDRPLAAGSSPGEEEQSFPVLWDMGERKFPLKGNAAAIGRKGENDIVLQDVRVSGRHALVKREGHKWYVEDLNSKNGTSLGNEKISCKILSHGDVVNLGGVKLQFLLPGLPLPEAGEAELIGPAIEEVETESKWAKITPLIILAALLAVFAGGYGVADYLFAWKIRDVPSERNLLGAESFSFEFGAEQPKGWVSGPGAVLKRIKGGLPPGRYAGMLASKKSGGGSPVFAGYSEPLSVVPGKLYELQGFCSFEGKGACGLAVKWLEGREVADISYSDLCRSGKRLVVSNTFRCPDRCDRGSVSLVVFGSGKGVFDQVEFKTGEPASAANGSAALRKIKRAPFELQVDQRGVFDLLLGQERILGRARVHLGEVVKEMPGQALGFGGSADTEEGKNAEQDSLTVVRNIYVPGRDLWIPVRCSFALSDQEGSAEWLFPREALPESLRIAVVFRLPEDILGGGKRFVAYGPLGREVVSSAELVGLEASELVVSGLPGSEAAGGHKRIVLSFPEVGTLLKQGTDYVLHLEKGTELPVDRKVAGLRLKWSFASSKEKDRMQRAISEAGNLAQAGKLGKAISLLEETRDAVSPDERQGKSLASQLASLRKEAQALLKQAEAMLEDLKEKGGTPIAQALDNYLSSLERRFKGHPGYFKEIKDLRLRMQVRDTAVSRNETVRGLKSTLVRARELFQSGSYAVCQILLEEALQMINKRSGFPEGMRRDFRELRDECERRLKRTAELLPSSKKEVQ